MLIRVVHMTFQPERVKDFLIIFENSKDKIKDSEGCLHLELLKDYHDENIFSTYSYWESEEHLDRYRSSEVFKNIWSETKGLFSEKPNVFSFKKFIQVG